MSNVDHIKNNLADNALSATIPERVYFLGIGGIGMSALARYFHFKGAVVSGYDKTKTLLTTQLENEGIAVHYIDDIELADTKADLVVYTPAVPKDHTEYNYFLDHGYDLQKRSKVLGTLTAGHYNICVAGTHGKTTTSAMIAHLLTSSGKGCNAFLGGIATNYNSNLILSTADTCVVEADEYDHSFLQLSPTVAVITAMDADHLDIYGTEEKMQEAFLEFAGKIYENGLLILAKGIDREAAFNHKNLITYSATDKSALAHIQDCKIINGCYHVDVKIKDEIIQGIELCMGGEHNLENMLAAIVAAKHAGLSDAEIKVGAASFKGVKRRFEIVLKNDQYVMIDDYAHHPEELQALIDGAKKLYPDYKSIVVFQPHLFSRTQDHATGFANVLEMADEAILLPIYPARELPIPGVSSSIILNAMQGKGSLQEKEFFLEDVKNRITNLPGKLMLIMAGAGDIDNLVLPVKQMLEAKSF